MNSVHSKRLRAYMAFVMMFVFCVIPFIIFAVMSQEEMCIYLPEGLHNCLSILGQFAPPS